MPECVEVYIISETLQSIVNKDVINCYVDKKAKTKNFNLIYPVKIIKVKSYGKKLIFKLSTNQYIIFSLGMTGTLTFTKTNYSLIH